MQIIVDMYDNSIPGVSLYHRSREHVVDGINKPFITVRAGQSLTAIVLALDKPILRFKNRTCSASFRTFHKISVIFRGVIFVAEQGERAKVMAVISRSDFFEQNQIWLVTLAKSPLLRLPNRPLRINSRKVKGILSRRRDVCYFEVI